MGLIDVPKCPYLLQNNPEEHSPQENVCQWFLQF